MAVPYSNTRLRVPKGFQNVLEGLAREVLRCQPENIYSFAADYFEELLKMRQETGYDDIALLGAKLEDRFYNNHSFKNPNTNTNNEEQQFAAVKIQSEYRRFAAKKEVDTKKEEEAAIVIQASFRGHAERQIQKPNSSDEINGISSDSQTNQHNTTDMDENILIDPNIDEPEIIDENKSDDLHSVHGENQNYQEYDLEDSHIMLENSNSPIKENYMDTPPVVNSEDNPEDTPPVVNSEDNPEEMRTGDESEHFVTDEENLGGPEVESHGDFVETNEKMNEDLEFDQKNQEVFTDEITNVTDNMMNEEEQIANEEITKSSIDSMEKLHVDDVQQSIDMTEIKDEEVNNDVEDVQQSLDFNDTEGELVNNNIRDISEVNDHTIYPDRITGRSEENIEEDREINAEQTEEVPIDEEQNLETENESVAIDNKDLDENVEQIEHQQEQEQIENFESHREENTDQLETNVEEDHSEEKEEISIALGENSEKAEENTIILGDEIDPEENEETLNETAAEAVDTERTVDNNNDLEDTVNDHEESNQVETNPTHEDNPESAGPTNDTDEAGTSRTDPDE